MRRPPSGWSASPEAAPLLLHRALFTATTLSASAAEDLGAELERWWGLMAPLHLWLVEHVQDA
jgi:hypothetical protein